MKIKKRAFALTGTPQDTNADLDLLAYLSVVVLIFCTFAFVLFWMMQPTVLANAPASGLTRSQPTRLLDAARDVSEDAEQLAIEAADLENREQGLEPLNTPRAVAGRAGSEPKEVIAATKQAPKQRRVVRAPARDTLQSNDPWQAWAGDRQRYSEWNGGRGWSNGRSDRQFNNRGWMW
jgi:hypothetical protein